MFTSLLIPALAAAVVGRMSSFPVTVLAGMVIGVAESEMAHYITAPGWPAALPFIIVFAVLAVRGRTLPRRGELTSTRLASVGSGRVRPLALMAVIALALVWIYTVSGSWAATTVTEITIGIVILSVVVVTGYAGQLSLCQFALAGVGAYVAGRLFAAVGLPFGVALLLAVVAAVPVGVVVGLPAVRSRGTDLAVATLCLAVAVESVLFDSAKLTGGDLGTDVSSASLFGIKMDTVTDTRGFAVVCLVFAVLAGLVVANLRRSRTGRQLLAIRSNERAAAALGISVVGVKLRAFTIGSAIAALGGALFAFENSPIVYTSFTWLNSPYITGFGVIGGVGYGAGPYFGSSLAPGSLGSSIGNLFGYNIQTYLLLASGFILILMVIQSPDGVAARTSRDIVKLGRMLARWAHAIVGEGRTLPRIPAARAWSAGHKWCSGTIVGSAASRRGELVRARCERVVWRDPGSRRRGSRCDRGRGDGHHRAQWRGQDDAHRGDHRLREAPVRLGIRRGGRSLLAETREAGAPRGGLDVPISRAVRRHDRAGEPGHRRRGVDRSAVVGLGQGSLCPRSSGDSRRGTGGDGRVRAERVPGPTDRSASLRHQEVGSRWHEASWGGPLSSCWTSPPPA